MTQAKDASTALASVVPSLNATGDPGPTSSLPGVSVSVTPTPISQMFLQAHEASARALSATLAGDLMPKVSTCHHFIDDLALWAKALSGHAVAPLLQLAKLEYEFAVFAAVRADYRSAFTRLRLFVELVCLSAYGSTHRIHLAEWLSGDQDTAWGLMMHEKDGILSPRFCQCFAKELTPEVGHIRGLTRNLYRDCSQFVHGNVHSTADVPIHIEFDRDTLERWLSRCDSSMVSMTFVLALRFSVDLDRATLDKLREPILERVGNMSQMQELFERLMERAQ